MKHINTVLAAILLVFVAVCITIPVIQWAKWRVWFDLLDRQYATIRRLEQYPPSGWEHWIWSNSLTVGTIWVNVTFHPEYSGLSNDQMRSLLLELEQILAETTEENSVESVDRIFALMLQFGKKPDFITAYREEFAQTTAEPARIRDLVEP